MEEEDDEEEDEEEMMLPWRDAGRCKEGGDFNIECVFTLEFVLELADAVLLEETLEFG